MPQRQITQEQLDEVTSTMLTDNPDVRDDYSGRFMYGERCVGVVGTPGVEIEFAYRVAVVLADAELAEFEEDEDLVVAHQELVGEIILWLSENMRSDNMGSEMIYYWPALTVQA